MTNKQKYLEIRKLPLKQRFTGYNKLITAYNSETGQCLEPLTSCGSCIKDFENYEPFKIWINGFN